LTPCGRVPVDNEAKSNLAVVGNQMTDSRGEVFVPYGISLVSGPETTNWARSEKAAAAQIVASHRFWNANAVRIQVSEAQLLDHPTPGRGYNAPFAASVNRLVCMVLKQGQIPVVSDTTLFTAQERGPTHRTVRFWKFMSERYGNRLPVIFDLFNEPRLGRNPHTNRFLPVSRVWRLWERGGTLGGKRYLGMQRLVDTIRIDQRVDNVIWVEEPWYLDVERLPTGQLPEHLLRGDNLVYAFHKATLEQGSRSFRDLRAVIRRGIPLVDSEWSQFAATDRPWECQDDAYRWTPGFLAFLRRVPIGLIAWSLQPGALVAGAAGKDTVRDGNDFRYTTNPADLATPTVMRPGYGCDRASRGQGAGALIRDYFARYSKAAPSALFPRGD
jgi:cellulase (glycosyl hydrolase family 5)